MATYAPKISGCRYSWKKSGIWEIKASTRDLPPWLDQKVLVAAQAAGSTLDWDLRHKPDLWKAVELWAWKPSKTEHPDQPALFAVDRTDPLSHLDMADFLGEAKVVAMSAYCVDRYSPLDSSMAYVYTLVLWFGIDVEKAFFGDQGEKALQRRKLQWVLGEKFIGYLTLNYMEATQVDVAQAELGLDDDEDDQKFADELRNGEIEITVDGHKVTSVEDLTQKVVDFCIKTDMAKQADTAREIPFTLKPAPEQPAKALASQLVKTLSTMPWAKAERLAELVGQPVDKVLKVAYDTPSLQVMRARIGGPTGSLQTMVWLKNLALQPMFEDAATEEKRLLAARADLLRLAEHVLREAPGTFMSGRELLEAVCAQAAQGNVARMLGQGLPGDDRFVGTPTGAAGSLDSDLCDAWSKWVFRLAGAAQSPAPAVAEPAAQEPAAARAAAVCACTSFLLDHADASFESLGYRHSRLRCCEVEPAQAPAVRWTDFDEPESVEVRMARMDKRIGDAMVESLRNASFDRSIHHVVSDCNVSVTCTVDDVARVAEADPRFALRPKHGSSPALVELVADPSRAELRAEVASWVESAVGYRMGKGELATKIQERWKLKNAAVGRAWLDFAVMPDNPQLVNLKANGIGLAAHWPQ